jgi:hypothetical protein
MLPPEKVAPGRPGSKRGVAAFLSEKGKTDFKKEAGLLRPASPSYFNDGLEA